MPKATWFNQSMLTDAPIYVAIYCYWSPYWNSVRVSHNLYLNLRGRVILFASPELILRYPKDARTYARSILQPGKSQ